jgi:hypothetical protein
MESKDNGGLVQIPMSGDWVAAGEIRTIRAYDSPPRLLIGLTNNEVITEAGFASLEEACKARDKLAKDVNKKVKQ